MMGCSVEKNTGLTNDPRYSESGIYTTEFDMRDDSGIYSRLALMPSYFSLGPDDR